MANINVKTKERFIKGIKKFQPILLKAKSADINESDTVTIVVDMLSDVFGYDKYDHITSEYAIKKTFCDLAIIIDGKARFLIECKSAGLTLKDDFIRQATNYAADSGIDWVVLTNGVEWKVYKVHFTKPIEKELVYSFDFTTINSKKQSDLDNLFHLSIDAFTKNKKSSLEDLHSEKQILNKYVLSQIILSETVITSIKKQIKLLSSDIKPDNESLIQLINSEIMKRELFDCDECSEAKKKVQKIQTKKITK